MVRTILTEHWGAVYALALGASGDPDPTYDATVEAFLKLPRELLRGTKIENLRSWLRVVARNWVRDQQRWKQL